MIPRKLEAYYDPISVAVFFGFLLFHAILYAMPFGFITTGPPAPNGKRMLYRISGKSAVASDSIGNTLLFLLNSVLYICR